MTETSVATPCAFVRPGRAILRLRPDHDAETRSVDFTTLWVLDRRATSLGMTVEAGIYKLTLPHDATAGAPLPEDPLAHTEPPERYTLVFFDPGKLAVYLRDSEP